jgi:hypothetical protein
LTHIPAQFWLEKARLWVQGGWFVLFLLSLCLSIGALKRPHHHGWRVWSRGLWATAMLFFVAMWIAGPVLELMRRAVLVSRWELILALGAFSILLAGVLSLVREWFGPTGAEGLRGESVAFSLLVLTLAGWWFGGVALEGNALWNFAPSGSVRSEIPDGWALSLSGATLLGVSNLVRRRGNSQKRVANPRAATWWLLAFALMLILPWRGQNLWAASAFLAGAGTFACKMWRLRRDCPRFLRINVGTRAVLISLLTVAPLWSASQEIQTWRAQLFSVWTTPLYVLILLGMLVGARTLGFRARGALRSALHRGLEPQISPRILLHATISGTLAATLLLGPAGAPFFAFWPLCGLFFDLLAPREHQRESQREHQPTFRAESQSEREVAAIAAAP